MRRNQDFFRGCLLGGAIGDALGWPVEFRSWGEIVRVHGVRGIQDLIPSIAGKAAITDDTQMTLFTAEGLLRALVRGKERGICHVPSVVHGAYIRWLHTQRNTQQVDSDDWLVGVRALHHNRAPGNSCLSALRSGRIGKVEEPINDSKGCGAVMRAAPVGLLYHARNAFQIGMGCGALTHGHPSGYLAAGALAQIVSELITGADLLDAVQNTTLELKHHVGHEECSQSLCQAVKLANSSLAPLQAIKQLGQGWVGEEAPAIAVYCSLKFPDDFRGGLVASVNHDGDSDSTGAITGNILGAKLGLAAIPAEWLELVELKEEVTQVADDLLIRYRDDDDWRRRYPGH